MGLEFHFHLSRQSKNQQFQLKIELVLGTAYLAGCKVLVSTKRWTKSSGALAKGDSNWHTIPGSRLTERRASGTYWLRWLRISLFSSDVTQTPRYIKIRGTACIPPLPRKIYQSDSLFSSQNTFSSERVVALSSHRRPLTNSVPPPPIPNDVLLFVLIRKRTR